MIVWVGQNNKSVLQLKRGMATLNFLNSGTRVGYHITKKPTLTETFTRMLDTPLRAYQLYLGNARSWSVPKVDPEDIVTAGSILRSNNKYGVIHASLLYNMAGATNGDADPKYDTSLATTRHNLTTELDIAAGSGCGVVVHIGSRKDSDLGMMTIAETINHVLTTTTDSTRTIAKYIDTPISDFKSQRRVILENSAGEGNKLGATLDEIATIINMVDSDHRDQVSVCIDTAHAFGAGSADFGVSENVIKFYDDFDSIIGLDRLEVFHLNDSRVAYNAKRDLHENLGLGYQFGSEREDNNDGMLGLYTFMTYAEYHGVPIIGEPPAKTKDKKPGPGGMWDYDVLRSIYPVEHS